MMDYMPHGACWFWNWKLILLHLPSDLAIFACYMTIAWMSWRVLRSGSQHMPATPPRLWKLFAAFVFLCGLTHLNGVLEVFIGGRFYYATGVAKVVTAIVSSAFVRAMWREQPDLEAVAAVLDKDHR